MSSSSRTGKHLITEFKDLLLPGGLSALEPVGKGRGGRLLGLGPELIPGALRLECRWIVPPGAEIAPHVHDGDEVLGFFGTDPERVRELGGEVEVVLGEERQALTQSCLVYVPAGLEHAVSFRGLARPLLFFFALAPEEQAR
jgi:mannose-6-phosphate isomerase-like protein (cupin superfamily)